MVMPMPSSGFWERLQQDGVSMAVAIDLLTPGGDFFWTTQNDDVRFNNSSGALTTYTPFPGIPPLIPVVFDHLKG